MPGLTTRTRDGSAPKASTTSPATKAESVWTQAPRRRARRIRPGVGQRRLVAELGMVQRREVVHRDHGGGATGRRHHEVGPVHDVGGADEPLQRWHVPSRPQRVQRAGRHGPLAGRDAVGQLCLDQPAAAPADGVGPHVDVRGAAPGRARAPWQNAPTPVGSPSSGVASSATRRRRRFRGPGRVGGAQVVIAPSMERIAP